MKTFFILDKLDNTGNVIKSSFQDAYQEFQRRKSVSFETVPISNEKKTEEKSPSIEIQKFTDTSQTAKPIPAGPEKDSIKPTPIKPIPVKQESEPIKQASVQKDSGSKSAKDPSNGSVKSVKIDKIPKKPEADKNTAEDMRVRSRIIIT